MTEQRKATREAMRLNELVAYAIIRSYKPVMSIYSVGHKKTCHFYFYDNFGHCGPISIILSLLDS